MDVQEYLKRGIEYYEKYDYDRAVAELTEALRLDPNLAKTKKYLASSYFNRGITSYQKGDKDRAIDDFTKAIEYDRTEARFLGALAVAYKEKENYDKSIEVWTAFIELDKTASGYHSRAREYYGKSKRYRLAGDKDNFFKYLDLAIQDFEDCLKHNPDAETRASVQKQLELALSEKKAREKVYEGVEKLSGIL